MSKEVIYGKNSILEALRAGRYVYKLLITNEVIKKEDEIRKLIKDLNIKHEIIDSKKMKKIVHQKYDLSGQLQGLVAEVAKYEYMELNVLLGKLKNQEKSAFIVMLDGLADVHNLGAILRSAEAVGVDAVIIPKHGSVGLTSTVARLSAGALEYVPVICVTNLNRTIESLKKAGVWLVGTDASDSEDYRTVDMTMPVCVVIGSEGRGMSRLVKEACDFKVHLTMIGNITSLNASVAAALVMYEVFNQRNPVTNTNPRF